MNKLKSFGLFALGTLLLTAGLTVLISYAAVLTKLAILIFKAIL